MLAFASPALPLHSAGPYVAAAYIVFVAVILLYVAIMAVRLTRNRRDIEELAREVRERNGAASVETGHAAGGERPDEREIESVS